MPWVAGDSERRIAQLYASLGHPREDTQDVRAAAAAARQWVLDNQAAYNAVLPAPFRTSATAVEKSFLLRLVLEHEFGNG